jgi:Skp family chaperone for outer membrane proteins
MHRNTLLVLAAGAAGAISTTIAGHALSTTAWAEARPHVAEPRTAVVDVLGLLEGMLDKEAFAEERNSEDRGWNEQLQATRDEAQALLQSLQALDPDDAESPQAQTLYAQYQSASNRFNQLQQQRATAMDRLAARQLTEAYVRIHAEACAIAEAEGYDRVYASRMTADGIDAQSTNAVVQEIMIRPLLYDVAGDDLTDRVRESLDIPESASPEAEVPVLEPETEQQR